MKIVTPFLFVILSICSFAQVAPLPSKVFVWDNSSTISNKNGSIKKIMSGSAAILAEHTINGVSLSKGKSLSYKNDAGQERFFIIKNGPLTVTLNGNDAVLDRGSVVSVMPGDNLTINNRGETTAAFYEMIYHSIAPVNLERGRKAGGSFILNWNDISFKPTDKGGVRQFFDRQTAMLNRFDIHVTQLNEGFKSHDPHTHTNEEIILMLDGNAEMQIGTDHQKANPGDVVFLNSMVLHNLTNVGKTPCLYFAIQWN